MTTTQTDPSAAHAPDRLRTTPNSTARTAYLTVEEAAEYLQVSTKTIRDLILSQRLKAIKPARHYRISPAALAAFEDSCAVASPTSSPDVDDFISSSLHQNRN
jgi:excisionase family DNA binding protein